MTPITDAALDELCKIGGHSSDSVHDVAFRQLLHDVSESGGAAVPYSDGADGGYHVAIAYALLRLPLPVRRTEVVDVNPQRIRRGEPGPGQADADL